MEELLGGTTITKQLLFFNLSVCVDVLDFLKPQLTKNEYLAIHDFAVKLQLILKDSKLI